MICFLHVTNEKLLEFVARNAWLLRMTAHKLAELHSVDETWGDRTTTSSPHVLQLVSMTANAVPDSAEIAERQVVVHFRCRKNTSHADAFICGNKKNYSPFIFS